MTSCELEKYISERNHHLTREEILQVINVTKNPMIDHILFNNGEWSMWDKSGSFYCFTQKNKLKGEYNAQNKNSY